MEERKTTSIFHDLMKNRPLLHHNGQSGQHRFGPPTEWTGPPPMNGCEVFVSKLPKGTFEAELIPIFAKSGEIFEIRLMMDFSGPNRGYAIVNYMSRNDAFCALRELNGFEIRPGKNICVTMINKRLFVGNIPKSKTKGEVFEELSKWVPGICDVILYKDCYDHRLNRGFAIVKFASHGEAAKARRALVPFCERLWDHEVIVEWAAPEPDPYDKYTKDVKALYVRYFLLSTTPKTIETVFEEATKSKIYIIKKKYDYAILSFFNHEHAMLAMKTLESIEIDNCSIEISWASPGKRKWSRIPKHKVVYEQHLEKKAHANSPKRDVGIGTSYRKSTCGFATDSRRIFPNTVTVTVLKITHWLQMRLIQCAKDTCVHLQYRRHTQKYSVPLDPWQTYRKMKNYVQLGGTELCVGQVNPPQDERPLMAVPTPIGYRPSASCSLQQA